MPDENKRTACMQRCTADYIRYIGKNRSGGVETLRICREKCPTAE